MQPSIWSCVHPLGVSSLRWQPLTGNPWPSSFVGSCRTQFVTICIMDSIIRPKTSPQPVFWSNECSKWFPHSMTHNITRQLFDGVFLKDKCIASRCFISLHRLAVLVAAGAMVSFASAACVVGYPVEAESLSPEKPKIQDRFPEFQKEEKDPRLSWAEDSWSMLNTFETWSNVTEQTSDFGTAQYSWGAKGFAWSQSTAGVRQVK